jgi:UDP-glucose 4-epimerase
LPVSSVVTGGAGFIGSHLVDRLIELGHDVTVVDNFATGRESNLAAAAGKVTLHRADVADLAAIAPAFDGATYVFHLAGLADIVPSIEKPIDYYRTNADGTANVMECARRAGVRKVVYTASSTCYGLPDLVPTPETAEIRTQFPYALTKHLGELTALHWGRVYGIPTNSLRLFNVYGPRSRTTGAYGAVFGVFLAQKLAGRPYTVVGDGNQSRDFTFVSDVVEAFVAAATAGVAGEVVHLPKRPGEPDATFADVRKIEAVLGWRARVPFAEGVNRMLAAIDLWRDAPVWDEASIANATAAWFSNLGRPAAAR